MHPYKGTRACEICGQYRGNYRGMVGHLTRAHNMPSQSDAAIHQRTRMEGMRMVNAIEATTTPLVAMPDLQSQLQAIVAPWLTRIAELETAVAEQEKRAEEAEARLALVRTAIDNLRETISAVETL